MAAADQALKFYNAGDLAAAEREARAALDAGTDNARLRHLLGVLLCRRGALEQGALEFQRGLELESANLGLRVMLVRALIDLGRGDEALRNAPRPGPGPAAAELWRLRAEAAAAAGAFACQKEALTHCALETVNSALAKEPHRLELMFDRARLLAVLRRDSEAEEAYRAILEREPASLDAVRELGAMLERTNRADLLGELVSDARRAGIDPEAIAFLMALLAWRDRKPQEARDWLAKARPGDDPVRVAQLACKVEDALGHSAAAFEAAERMNRAVADRDSWRTEAAKYRAQLRGIAEVITADWAASWTPASVGDRRPPVFLVGFPRSGTTLLDTFLMGHPGVTVLEEIPLLDAVDARLGPYERLARLGHAEIEQLRQVYFDAMITHVPQGFAGVVVDKMPLNMLCAALIYRLFPDALFVFAQRHPCDCVLSGFMQGFRLNPATACFLDLADAADFYDAALEVWTRTEQALPLRVHRLLYERLVEDPERELRGVIDEMGLQWHDGLLDHRATARARGAIATASYDQVTEPIHRRASGRWRRYAVQLEPALPLLLGWADRLGYDSELVDFPN